MIKTAGARFPDSIFGRRSVPASETFAPSNLTSFDSKAEGEAAAVGDGLFLFWAPAMAPALVKINSEVVILIDHFIISNLLFSCLTFSCPLFSRLSHKYSAFA